MNPKLTYPKRRVCIQNQGIEGYLKTLGAFSKEKPTNLRAKVEIYRFLSKQKKCVRFESMFNRLKDHPNHKYRSAVYQEYVKHQLFVNNSTENAMNAAREAINLNPYEPSWMYYFAKIDHAYYENLFNGLLYTAIPKNASTSLKTFVLENLRKTDAKRPHAAFGSAFFRSQIYSKEVLQASKKVLIVRNPIDRICSYHRKNIIESDSLATEYGVSSKDHPRLFELKLRPTFNEFLRHLNDYCLVFNDVLHHCLPQSAYMASLDTYDFICDISEVENLVDYVAKEFDLPSQKRLQKRMASKNDQQSITEKEQRFLLGIYADDYVTLQKHFNKLPLAVQNYSSHDTTYNFVSTDLAMS